MANDPNLQPATHPNKYRTRDDFVKDLCPGKVCAEVGVCWGSFSEIILAQKPLSLLLVDPWIHQDEKYYPGDQANMPNLQNKSAYRHVCGKLGVLPNVTVLRECSFDVARIQPDGHFDFVFLDAIHSLPMVLADCVAWWPKIKKGGWLTGHDFNLGEMPGCPALSVNAALQQFLFLIHRDKLDIVTYEQDSWGIQN